MAGDFKALPSIAEEGRDLADAIGDGFTSRQCQYPLIAVHIYRGQLTDALGMLQGLISEATTSHDPTAKMIGLQMQAITLAYHGDARVRASQVKAYGKPA